MKKFLLSLSFVIFLVGKINAQQQLNLPLLSNWDDNSLPVFAFGSYNDCWGYAAPDGREYAIVGAINGTLFFDVTDPTNPVLISYEPGKDSGGVHRDYKTYQHYAYGVCDEGNSSLQIWDLQYLPDSVVKVYDSDQFSTRCHNIFISDDKLFLASNTVNFSLHAMDVLSLANPESPTFISTLTGPFWHIHDVFVRNDTAFCSAGNEGFFIYDYTNPTNPLLIQSITAYPEKGYNHSTWVSGNILVFADENHGLALKVYDISNILSPQFLSLFRSNLLNIQPPNTSSGSIPHNPFIRNDKAVVSYYHDGVQIFDLANPSSPQQVAYYDTYPQNNDYNSYQGCWGVYPFLPSGNIIASDIENGLFMLDGYGVLVGTSETPDVIRQTIFPNPFKDGINIKFNGQSKPNALKITLSDVLGKVVSVDRIQLINDIYSINTSNLQGGVYYLTIDGNDYHYSSKLVKIP